MSLAAKLKNDEKLRLENEAKAKEIAAKRVADRKEYEEKLRREEYDRICAAQDEAERKQREEKEAREREIQRKTKPYFKLNKYNRKVPTDEDDVYFGEWKGAEFGDAWVADGEGQLLRNGRTFMTTNFQRGIPHGNSVISFDSGEEWIGPMSNGALHGAGKLRRPRQKVDDVGHLEHDAANGTLAVSASRDASRDDHERSVTIKALGLACTTMNQPPGSRVWIQDGSSNTEDDVIMRHNIVMCKKNDLVQGRQVIIHDFGNDEPRMTIIKHVRRWRYICRFHRECVPREKGVDFSTLNSFKVLLNEPLVYYLTNFGLETEAPRMYDYFKDTFGRSYKDIKDSLRTPTLTKAVAYEAKPLSVRNRTRSDYSENKFEAEATGLCKAIKSELAEIHRPEERAIHDNLIQKKRDEAEAERQRLIEEELKLEEEEERGQKRLAEEQEHQLELEEQEIARKAIEKLQCGDVSHEH